MRNGKSELYNYKNADLWDLKFKEGSIVMVDRGGYYGKITLGKAGFFVKLALLCVAVCLLVTSFTLLMKYDRLVDEQERLEAEIAAAEVRAAELEYELGAPMDRDYIIRVAHKKLGLVLPEEIVYYTDLESID